MNKANEVAAVIPMPRRGEGMLPIDTLHFIQDWLQPNAMFVDCPQVDTCLREGHRHPVQQWELTVLEVCLRLDVSQDIARIRHPRTSAQPPQVDPAHLTADWPCQSVSRPSGDGAPVLTVVLWGQSTQRYRLSASPCQASLIFDTLARSTVLR
jgi:hypothetical protein